MHAYGTKLGVQLFHPEYDVDAINSLFMQKKFDEMRQRLHHDMMFLPMRSARNADGHHR